MQAMAAKLASPPLNLCFRINTLRISANVRHPAAGSPLLAYPAHQGCSGAAGCSVSQSLPECGACISLRREEAVARLCSPPPLPPSPAPSGAHFFMAHTNARICPPAPTHLSRPCQHCTPLQDALRELQQQICSREGWSALGVSPLAELPNVVVLKGHGPHAVDTTSAQGRCSASPLIHRALQPCIAHTDLSHLYALPHGRELFPAPKRPSRGHNLGQSVSMVSG